MAYEQKLNTGSLFKNDRKAPGDSKPDYTGTALIDGLGECWLDAWVNTAANGSRYMSLKIKPKEARQDSNRPVERVAAPQSAFDGGLDDDVPF